MKQATKGAGRPVSVRVGRYRIAASQDEFGFLRLEVRGGNGQDVLRVEHPWCGEEEDSEMVRIAVTGNKRIIDWEWDSSKFTDRDGRINCEALRSLMKDAIFRAWWKLNGNKPLETLAREIEEKRKEEAAGRTTAVARALGLGAPKR